MTTFQMISATIVLTGLLLFVAKITKLPQTLLLLAAGLLIGWLPDVPRIEPDGAVLLSLLLPPILYVKTVRASDGLLRRNWSAAVLLGLVLVAAMTAIIGAFANWWLSLPALAAALLGLIAAVGGIEEYETVAKEFGAPRFLSDALRVEKLVAPFMLLGISAIVRDTAKSGEFSIANALATFAARCAGGVLLGIAIGWLFVKIRRNLDSTAVEIAVSLAAPYTASLAAHFIDVSGAGTIITTGFFVASRSVNRASGETLTNSKTRAAGDGFWETLRMILSGALFFVAGLVLPPIFARFALAEIYDLILSTMLVFGFALALRFLFALVAVSLAQRLRESDKAAEFSDKRKMMFAAAAFLTWANTRSALGVIIALSVPVTLGTGEPFPARDFIIALMGLLALLSIGLQSLTFAPLARRLNLSDSRDKSREEFVARRAAVEAGLKVLRANSAVAANRPNNRRKTNANAFAQRLRQRLREDYEWRLQRLRAIESNADDQRDDDSKELAEFIELHRETVAAERLALLDKHDRNLLSDESYQAMIHQLDVEAERLNGDFYK